MYMRYWILCLALFLGACQATSPEVNRAAPAYQKAPSRCVADQTKAKARVAEAKATGVLIIHNDQGGCIRSYQYTVDKTPAEMRIEISGVCESACTLFLGHPGTCAMPDTVFAFHGPSDFGEPLSPFAFQRSSRLMARYYPEPLKGRFMLSYRFRYQSDDLVPIPAIVLIAEGVLRACR